MLMALGLGLTAAGQIMGGFAKKSALEDQAVQNRIAAVHARLKARSDAETIREQGGRFQSQQAAGFAKSGVLIDSGSPLAVLMDTAIHVERNALRTILHGEQEGTNYEASASSLMKAGRSAALTGILSGIGSGISAARSYQGYEKAGKSGGSWGLMGPED
jgi:hypothetical protein